MKKVWTWSLIGAALVGLGTLLPFQSKDVAQLVPIEALIISIREDRIVMDGGSCQGRGETWDEAWHDLQNSAEGYVFTGTAEQIVLVGGAVKLLPEAATSRELRPAANVCVSLGSVPDPEKAAAYLSAHNDGVTLQEVRTALQNGVQPELPILLVEEGGMRLYETKNG